jgi:signal transduction histidine kinase/ActR/RegA family two-component response regulator
MNRNIFAAFSISRSLKLFAVFGLLTAYFVTYQQLSALRDAKLAETTEQMAQLDMVLAEQTGRAIDTADLLLQSMIEAYSLNPQAVDETQETTKRRMIGLRQVLGLDLIGANGALIASTRPRNAARLPPMALALLVRHQIDPNSDVLISEPFRDEAGRWVTLMTRRMTNDAGAFTGIGEIWINLTYFEEFYGAVQLGDDGAILLHRRDGTVLARYPHNDLIVGASYADMPSFKDVLARASAGTLEMDSALDQSRRILAIRALRSFPLAVNVSVNRDPVLASWRHQAWAFGLSMFAGSAVAAILMFKLANRTAEVERLLVNATAAHSAAEAANRDLTIQMEERQRAEAALRNSQRLEALGQLTGGVAHDFNNLLTVILGNIDLMQTHPAASVFTGRLTTMRSAAERGARLVSQLLAFARRQPLLARAVDLCALITAMRPLLESAVGSHISITFDLAANVPPALIDQTQIELVVLNLAINARDAMPVGGSLRLEVRRVEMPRGGGPNSNGGGYPGPGTYVRLRVSDTGTGMTPEVVSRAFEPYFTTKAPGVGSGLGLSQVYGVAHQSGGTARIESIIGQGTTIEVLLPKADVEEVVPDLPTDSYPGSMEGAGEASILVVDDDTDVRVTTALLLRRMGYRVTEAAGAGEALIALELDDTIQLLLTDVVMPEVSGVELARKAMILRPDLPIVYFSGYADPEAIVGAIPLARMLRKPFRPAELVALIETALAEGASGPISAGKV